MTEAAMNKPDARADDPQRLPALPADATETRAILDRLNRNAEDPWVRLLAEGHDPASAASVMGCSVRTAVMRFDRARAWMQSAMNASVDPRPADARLSPSVYATIEREGRLHGSKIFARTVTRQRQGREQFPLTICMN